MAHFLNIVPDLAIILIIISLFFIFSTVNNRNTNIHVILTTIYLDLQFIRFTTNLFIILTLYIASLVVLYPAYVMTINKIERMKLKGLKPGFTRKDILLEIDFDNTHKKEEILEIKKRSKLAKKIPWYIFMLLTIAPLIIYYLLFYFYQ